MACHDFGSPGFHAWVRYALARVTRDPPRITQWYSGPNEGWVNDRDRAAMFASSGAARLMRDALGSGVIVQVYDMITEELVAEF